MLAFAVTGCDDNGSDEGSGEVMAGSACVDDGQCPGPGTPDCIEAGIYPLTDMADSDSGMARDLADIGIPLPGGYCSTVPPCIADADCGLGGTCFFPLRDRIYNNIENQKMFPIASSLRQIHIGYHHAVLPFQEFYRPSLINTKCLPRLQNY